MANYFEHGNEGLGFIKAGDILNSYITVNSKLRPCTLNPVIQIR
jgi:hypothetical protein